MRADGGNPSRPPRCRNRASTAVFSSRFLVFSELPGKGRTRRTPFLIREGARRTSNCQGSGAPILHAIFPQHRKSRKSAAALAPYCGGPQEPDREPRCKAGEARPQRFNLLYGFAGGSHDVFHTLHEAAPQASDAGAAARTLPRMHTLAQYWPGTDAEKAPNFTQMSLKL